ncbi:MAG: hypothetical protein WCJ30_19385 [Deltaproteobacteria bacterium]
MVAPGGSFRERALFALLSVGVAACGAAGVGAGATSPRGTLVALAAAADRGDADALYALLPEGARRAESLTAFRARMVVEQPEVRDLAAALRSQMHAGLEPRVNLALRSGATVAVDDDPDGWRVAEPGLGGTLAGTPAAAARALRAALQRQSLPALLSVLSATARGALRAEMRAMIDALADPSALETTSTSNSGQRVELRLPDGHTLRLVREGSSWRVDDVQ